jgi:hypothetical protein
VPVALAGLDSVARLPVPPVSRRPRANAPALPMVLAVSVMMW